MNEPSMKAIRIHQFGSPEVMALETVERPHPGPDEILVRVAAAGVGPWDAWVREGKSVLPQPLPLTPGSDVSGTIVELGAAVTGFSLDEKVFGATNSRFTGGYAEYATVKTSMAAHKPRGLKETEAAAAPVVTVTAWQMLFDHARIHADQRVLVLGAGGSVGACAVQLALGTGARVIGADVPATLEAVRALGAHEVVDASAAGFEASMAPVDAVIDTVGGAVQTRAMAALKSGGVLVSSVSEPDAAEAARRAVRAEFILVAVNTVTLMRIGRLMEDRELTVRVGAVLALAEARTAHEMLTGRRPRPRGKIVLAVEQTAGAMPTAPGIPR